MNLNSDDNTDLKHLTDYCKKYNLSQLRLAPLSLDDLNERSRRGVYDRVVKLMKKDDSNVEIAQTQLDEGTFHRLGLLKIEDIDFLTKSGNTVGSVISALKDQDIQELLNQNGWMGEVKEIYESFDYEHFEPFVLAATPHKDSEANLFIIDGNHRAIALAMKVIEDHVYRHVDAIIIYFNEKYDI